MNRSAYMLGLSLLAFMLPECVDQLSLENRACPCLDGWKCCEVSGTCMPNELSCKEAPCSPRCDTGEYCYLQSCQECDDNRHCGPDCVNCNDQVSDWACLGDHCGCRDERDCPGGLDCINGVCFTMSISPDAGVGDGGSEDGGTGDGGDGTDECGYNSKCCGNDRKDCTELSYNWTCVEGRCGCLASNDCPPDMRCVSYGCVQVTDGGLDGGN